MSDITRRVEAEAEFANLVAVLGERLSPSDLQSILMEATRRRVSDLKPSRILNYYEDNRFTSPSSVDPRAFIEWDQIAFSELPSGYASLELSPVCPLGTVSAVTGLSQDWVVSTNRNTEVISDPTNVLALEYAARRQKAELGQVVKLAASHRVVRGQKYDRPGALPHFRMFGLCIGGRDTGNLSVELHALREHSSFYLRALRRFLGDQARLKLSFTEVEGVSHRDLIEKSLIERLRTEHPDVQVAWDTERESGRRYYRTLCFHIHADHPDGRERELVDGGDVAWAEELLNSGKERLIISAIGTEGLCANYRSR